MTTVTRYIEDLTTDFSLCLPSLASGCLMRLACIEKKFNCITFLVHLRHKGNCRISSSYVAGQEADIAQQEVDIVR